jgi:hypothetical protein
MHLSAALGLLLREGRGEMFIDPPFGSSSTTFCESKSSLLPIIIICEFKWVFEGETLA